MEKNGNIGRKFSRGEWRGPLMIQLQRSAEKQ
jgi:hypothetical protein